MTVPDLRCGKGGEGDGSVLEGNYLCRKTG